MYQNVCKDVKNNDNNKIFTYVKHYDQYYC